MTKKPGKPTKSFTESEVGVLLENIDKKFDILAEGQEAIKADMKSVINEICRQKEDIFIIKADIRVLKGDIKDIKKLLGSHDKRIKKLEMAA